MLYVKQHDLKLKFCIFRCNSAFMVPTRYGWWKWGTNWWFGACYFGLCTQIQSKGKIFLRCRK